MKGRDSFEQEDWRWSYRITNNWQTELGCTVWGLEVCDRDGKTVVCIPDLSSDREFVEQAAQLFEQERLEPIHLTEVVEDLLAVGKIPL